jgi:hypothetical protein
MKKTALLFFVGVLLCLVALFVISNPLFSIVLMIAGGIFLAIAQYKFFNSANKNFRKPRPTDW